MITQRCSGAMTAACNQVDVQIVTIGAVLGPKRPMCAACRDAAGRLGVIERRGNKTP
jgi:hypothetical protein